MHAVQLSQPRCNTCFLTGSVVLKCSDNACQAVHELVALSVCGWMHVVHLATGFGCKALEPAKEDVGILAQQC